MKIVHVYILLRCIYFAFLLKYISLLKCTTLSLPVQKAIIFHPNVKSQS